MPFKNKIPKIRLYTLRHSRASHLHNKGVSIYDIANFLGHSDIRSTQIYLHTDKNYLEKLRKLTEI